MPWVPAVLLVACTAKDLPATNDGGQTGDGGGGTDPSTGEDTGRPWGGGDTPMTSASDPVWAPLEGQGAMGVLTWQHNSGGRWTWAEFRVARQPWSSSPAQKSVDGENRAWVLGLPYDVDVEIRAATEREGGRHNSESLALRNPALPSGVPVPELILAEEDLQDPTLAFLLLSVVQDDEVWKLILDRQGRVVWAHASDGSTSSMRLSVAGDHILWDERGARSMVHRMSLEGEIRESFELPGLHHTFAEASDGAVVWGGTVDGREVVRERAADGSVREIFDCSSWWAEHGAGVACDGNTLTWLPEDDTLFFSSDNETTVVHLARGTGEVLATWGTLAGSWSFAEGSSRFYKQHSPLRTPEGNLLLSSWRSNDDHTMVAREYSLDEERRVLTEVWTCDESSGIRAEYGGEVRRLPGGNTLLNYGPGGVIREYTPACEPVWELRWPAGVTLRRMSELESLYALVGPLD